MATTPGNQSEIKRLIREAGYAFQTVDRRRIEVAFGGIHRPWTVNVTMSEHWLSLWTYVCGVPEAPGRKAELSDLLLRLNEENALTKYAYHGNDLVLQMQYRKEHVDAEAMHGLISLLCTCATDDYPRIVRILTGDETLARLEKQFTDTVEPIDL